MSLSPWFEQGMEVSSRTGLFHFSNRDCRTRENNAHNFKTDKQLLGQLPQCNDLFAHSHKHSNFCLYTANTECIPSSEWLKSPKLRHMTRSHSSDLRDKPWLLQAGSDVISSSDLWCAGMIPLTPTVLLVHLLLNIFISNDLKICFPGFLRSQLYFVSFPLYISM